MTQETNKGSACTLADRPACRTDFIDHLIESVDRYNPTNAEALEQYLASQLSDCTYDAMANLALLKLYQLNTHLIKEDVITNILVKALTQPSSADFSFCLHLLPPHVLEPIRPGSEEEFLAFGVQKLYTLYSLLIEARFVDFWKTLESDDIYTELTADCTGFNNLIRSYISSCLDQSSIRVSSKLLQKWLNLDEANFKAWAKDQDWTLDEKTQTVNTKYRRMSQASSRTIVDTVQLSDLAKIIGHSK